MKLVGDIISINSNSSANFGVYLNVVSIYILLGSVLHLEPKNFIQGVNVNG